MTIMRKQRQCYSEVAISRLRTEFSSPSIDEGLRLQLTESLGTQTRERSRQYSLAESLEEANSYTSQVVDLSSSESLETYEKLLFESDAARDSCSMTRMAETIQHLEEMLSITSPGTERHKNRLSFLAKWYQSKFHRTNDISDMEESIEYRFSTSRSRKPGRLATSMSHSPSAMTPSS